MICSNRNCDNLAHTDITYTCNAGETFTVSLCYRHANIVGTALRRDGSIICSRHHSPCRARVTGQTFAPEETPMTDTKLPESTARTIRSVLIETQAYKLSKANSPYMLENPSELIVLLNEISHITQALMDLQLYENYRFGGI